MRSSLCSFVVILAVAIATAPGRAGDDREDLSKAQKSGATLSLEVILERAKKQIDGRIIDIEFEFEDGKATYEIYWIDQNGQRQETKINARNGLIIATKADH